MRTLLLLIHITAAATWLGASVTQNVVTPAMQKTGGAPAAAWMRQTTRLSLLVYMPASIIVLISGIWLVLRDSVYEFEQAFVSIGFLTVIVGAVLGMRVFGPGGRKAAEFHESGNTTAANALHKRLATFGLLDSALLIFTIWAMVNRLGL